MGLKVFGNDEQFCPACNINLEVAATKSKTGTAQWSLACAAHGRKTPQYATLALAKAGVTNKLLPNGA
jgi:hypothetical protein